MKRISWRRAILGFGCVLGASPAAVGQAIAPPGRAAGTDLNGLVHRMSEQVQHLYEDIESDLGRSPAGRHLLQDAQELSQAIDQFHESLHTRRAPAQVRQAYLGIDGSWHHLKEALARRGSSPAVDRAVLRVDQIDQQLHQVLTLDVPDPLATLCERMFNRVQDLCEDIERDLGQTPAGRHVLQDAQELATSVQEFDQAATSTTDLFQLRHAYSGIDTTWDHLKQSLAQRGSTAGIDRELRRVEEINVEIHQSLGQQDFEPAAMAHGHRDVAGGPPPAVGRGPAPDQFTEMQGYAFALDESAVQLASLARAEMGGTPEGARLAQDARHLARACDVFCNSIGQNQGPAELQAAFGPVAAISNRLQVNLRAVQVPPQFQQVWQTYVTTEVRIRQQLHLPVAQPVRVLERTLVVAQPQVLGMADTLLAEVSSFVQVFARDARGVPEGNAMLVDAQRMQAAAAAFREDAARGADPGRLAVPLNEVDVCWQRLSRRVQRVMRGRSGPRIQQVESLGVRCQEIHQALGILGGAPNIGAPVYHPGR